MSSASDPRAIARYRGRTGDAVLRARRIDGLLAAAGIVASRTGRVAADHDAEPGADRW